VPVRISARAAVLLEVQDIKNSYRKCFRRPGLHRRQHFQA
jgi:hypothetical protein